MLNANVFPPFYSVSRIYDVWHWLIMILASDSLFQSGRATFLMLFFASLLRFGFDYIQWFQYAERYYQKCKIMNANRYYDKLTKYGMCHKHFLSKLNGNSDCSCSFCSLLFYSDSNSILYVSDSSLILRFTILNVRSCSVTCENCSTIFNPQLLRWWENATENWSGQHFSKTIHRQTSHLCVSATHKINWWYVQPKTFDWK